VTRDAYERISGLLLDELRACHGVDAVYLDLPRRDGGRARGRRGRERGCGA